MKKRYREEQEEEAEPPVITYGRPSTSSWVAAGAVAFAFFMLGGFIKTYVQLEELREESRREINWLHDSIRRLEAEMTAAGRQMETPPPAYRVQPLPPARRERQEYRREPEPMREPPPPEFGEYADEAEPVRPRVQFGRRSAEESRQIIAGTGAPSQVVSVSGANKRLMIEGGRDIGMSEGLRLELCRDGRWIGDVRILDVFDNQSSCEVLHTTVEPLPGDTVRRVQR